MVIPTDLYVKLSYIYVLCRSNGVGITFITDFIFNFGIDIFTELIEEHGLRNIFDLMKIKDLIKNTLKTFFKKGNERYPMIDLSDYIKMEKEFERRKFGHAKRIEFLTFINHFDKSFLHKEKLLLDQEDIDLLFHAYDNIERETYEHF